MWSPGSNLLSNMRMKLLSILEEKLKEEITIRFCPRCKSTEIQAFAGGITGTWQCKNCNFLSPIFPEKTVEIEKNQKKNNKKLKINRKEKHGRRRK